MLPVFGRPLKAKPDSQSSEQGVAARDKHHSLSSSSSSLERNVWSQSQVATHIPASLEPFFAAQSENIGQRRELAHTIDLDQCLRFRVLGFKRRRATCPRSRLYGHVATSELSTSFSSVIPSIL
jgi:hypothetical protein